MTKETVDDIADDIDEQQLLSNIVGEQLDYNYYFCFSVRAHVTDYMCHRAENL